MCRCLAFFLLTLVHPIIGRAQFFEQAFGVPIQNGQIRDPVFVAPDPFGNVFVATGSGSIFKYDASGTFLFSWSGSGPNLSPDQTFYPQGIVSDANGDLYLTEPGNHVKKFSGTTGAFLFKFGGPGTADGNLDAPSGIAIGPTGNIFVVDRMHYRVQVFGSDGTYLAKFGTQGIGDGQFTSPWQIAVDGAGNAYVTDNFSHQIQKFTSAGVFLTKWGSYGNGNGQFNYSNGIAADAAGNIYLAEPSRIQKFDNNGTYLTQFNNNSQGPYLDIEGIAINASSQIFVGDEGKSRVQKLTSNGALISQFAGPLNDGQLIIPVASTAGADGSLYVADVGNNGVQKFTNTGTFLLKWGSYGSGDGQFGNLIDVAIDATENVYVADNGNNRIQKFTSTGDFVLKWGSPGSADGQFLNITSIAIDATGNVFVAEAERIQKFNSTGQFLTKWGTFGTGDGQFLTIRSIATDPDGNVYVWDDGALSTRVQKFDNAGNFLLKWGSRGDGNGQFGGPLTPLNAYAFKSGMTSLATGKILVSDLRNTYDNNGVTISTSNHIQLFDNAGVFISSWNDLPSASQSVHSYATDISSDSYDHVYLTDPVSYQVLEFQAIDFSGFSPGAAAINSQVTLNIVGATTQDLITINGIPAPIVSGPSPIKITVPMGATTGKIEFTKLGFSDLSLLSTREFVVLPFEITAVDPGIAVVGANVTISGAGFSSIQANNHVKFNGTDATVISCNPTSILVTVPDGATSGNVTVTVEDQTSSSPTEFKITTLAITGRSSSANYPSGSGDFPVTLTVNSVAEVQSAKIVTRGISAPLNSVKTDAVAIPSSGTQLKFSIPASYFSDPIGLYSYFILTDKVGNEITGGGAYTHLYAAEHTIPGLIFGKAAENYQLISIPLKLARPLVTDVFAGLGAPNKKKWRLFEFAGGITGELNSTDQINVGSGYWLIIKDESKINTGPGNTAEVTEKSPYSWTLVPGWNLIGNPYDFNISWTDVLEYNASPVGLGNLRLFRGGFVEGDILNRFKGAFVRWDGTDSLKIKIPVLNKGLAGGRISNNKEVTQNSIDGQEWQVKLIISDDNLRNELGGFGMHPEASDGKDRWDEVALPVPEGASTFDLVMKDLKGSTLVKDMVNTSDNHTWNGELTSQREVTLSWDHSNFGDNEKELIMEVNGRVYLTNMRTFSSTRLPAGSKAFKIHFGSEEYIKAATLGVESAAGDVFPNPITRNGESLKIYMSLPAGISEVRMELKNVAGQNALISGTGKYDQGRQIVEWAADISTIAAGLYVVQIVAQQDSGIKSFYRKVVVE